MSLQHSKPGNSWQVQIENNEIQFEVWVGHHLKCLLAITGNVKSECHRTARQHLLYEQRISGAIFNQKDMSGFQLGNRTLGTVPGFKQYERVTVTFVVFVSAPARRKLSQLP